MIFLKDKSNRIVSSLKTLFPKALWKEFKLLTKIHKVQACSGPGLPLQFHLLLFNYSCFLSFLENPELFPSEELMPLFFSHELVLPLAFAWLVPSHLLSLISNSTASERLSMSTLPKVVLPNPSAQLYSFISRYLPQSEIILFTVCLL